MQSLHPVKGDHGTAVRPTFAVAGKDFIAAVLDADKIGERLRDPSLGNRRRQALVVRWVCESNVEAPVAERVEESEGIGPMNYGALAGGESRDVRRDRLEAFCGVFDEVRFACAA